MEPNSEQSSCHTYIAFKEHTLLAKGNLLAIAITIKAQQPTEGSLPILIFNEHSGKQIDIDISGDLESLQARFGHTDTVQPDNTTKRRGRPKLGVVGREITLLPRHWEWLDSQQGGASSTLRRLVDEARKGSSEKDDKRQSQNRTHHFLNAIAGDLPGFESVMRALFAQQQTSFNNGISHWPQDIQHYARQFSQEAFNTHA